MDALNLPNAKGGKRLTPSLHKLLHRLCRRAGVPLVCPHSLRGLGPSLAVAHGESSRAVAQAFGHGSDAITRQHYIPRRRWAPRGLSALLEPWRSGALEPRTLRQRLRFATKAESGPP